MTEPNKPERDRAREILARWMKEPLAHGASIRSTKSELTDLVDRVERATLQRAVEVCQNHPGVQMINHPESDSCDCGPILAGRLRAMLEEAGG